MMNKLILVVTLLFGAVSLVQAHDPGLSRANVVLQGSSLSIHMVFAWQDLQIFFPLDSDHDGKIVAKEFLAAQPVLKSIVMAGVNVQDTTISYQPRSVRIGQVPEKGIAIDFSYDFADASKIRIQVPLISQLARGHRQYMTVQDSSGNLLAQHILDASAAPVVLNEPGLSRLNVFHEYLTEGIWHIWIGFDHILFLLTLLLPAVLVYRSSVWRSVDELRPAASDVLKVVTAFTVAHSITLALAVLDIVSLSPRLVESFIAFSVLVTSLNNLRPVFPNSRWLLAFGFGLIHGFGFASVLVDLGLPSGALLISLLGFNLGVEVGQLAIVMLVFPVMALLRHTTFYRTWIFSGGSLVAALVATVWMFERVFNSDVPGI